VFRGFTLSWLRRALLVRFGPREQKIPMLNPYTRIAREAHLAWQRALLEFGMSASSRSRVKVSKPEKKDPFELFVLEGKKKA